ncbi:Sodium/calcium exchanger protein-domain-containing protein [Flammula alnicola]|nr:Sodium/calcium exchanger protein-domain-containing protein [Flammula alnicola]
MSNGTARFVFIILFAVNCILWSKSRYGQPMEASSLHSEVSLVKRISYELSQPRECQPLAFPIESQCQHVNADCPTPDTLLSIDYLHHYFCTDIALRPLIFTGLIVWLIFLFSTLGISASDFFTPNLATISQLLGLDENVAGVTLLAFGNGSPDVFSTFSAMKANSGSLAVGELLGAASFIVSCVVGSMCIIRPFQVHRGPFLRDVGFFTLAVGLVLVTLWDGKISTWEAGTLVGLYVIYVIVVIVGTWWENKKARKRYKEMQDRSEYAEEPYSSYTDERKYGKMSLRVPKLIAFVALPTLAVPTPSSPSRMRAISAPNPPRLQMGLPPRRYSRSPSPASSHVAQLPSFSLVGALEFRDVVASLQKQAAGNSLGIFESPVTPYAGGHYHTSIHRRSPLSSLHSSMDEETLNGLQLGERGRSPNLSPSSGGTARQEPRDFLSTETEDYFTSHSTQPIPAILRTPASPSTTASELESEEALYIPLTTRQQVWNVIWKTYHTLFPTLYSLSKQTLLAQMACVLAAPAVLFLTLTLPVVVTPYDSTRSSHEKVYNADSRLVEFEEEGMARVLIAEEEVEEDLHEPFNKWLMAAQCVLGPLFCVRVLFGGISQAFWILLGTLVAGLSVGILVLIFSDKGKSPAARMARCSMGFFVSIVWIMAIADEVVNVLQTFGLIFGLSDAIIGLTIFAVGNSLADLVANMSVAAFAPIMGFSACFGGPMLNILLGVGVSGSYIIHQTSQPYILKLSTTLFVSSFGLLFLLAATLIFVPMNDYFLTRRWGVLLIATYTVIMLINVIVELKS